MAKKPKFPEKMGFRDAVAAVLPKIDAALAHGYSWEDIATALAAELDHPVTEVNLKRQYTALTGESNGKPSRSRRKVSEQPEAPSAAQPETVSAPVEPEVVIEPVAEDPPLGNLAETQSDSEPEPAPARRTRARSSSSKSSSAKTTSSRSSKTESAKPSAAKTATTRRGTGTRKAAEPAKLEPKGKTTTRGNGRRGKSTSK